MKNQAAREYGVLGLFLTGLFFFGVCTNAGAQSWTQYDQGTPPQHATGVSPFGSYISTEIGTVSLTNGSLNIHLPLVTVGGRGMSIPLSLNYSSKVWSVGKETDWNPWNGVESLAAYATYGDEAGWIGYYNNRTPGWSIGGMPVITRRFVGIYPCDTGQGYQASLTKMSAVMPDGSEIQFRDDYYDGAPRWTGYCTLYNDVYRGLRWHATDGSGAIFIYDDSSYQGGTLITGEGTQYRFDSAFTTAISATDRNGNQITVTHPNGTTVYTDQLGRTVTISNDTVTFHGYQGASRSYQMHFDAIGNLIRSDLNYNHLPILTGYTDTFGKCYAGGQPPAANYLFPDSYCTLQQRIDDQSQLSQLDLPDGRSLLFRYNLYGEVAEVTLATGAKLQYDYAAGGGFPSGNTLGIEADACLNSVSDTDRAVTQRRTYSDGNTLEATWLYAFGPANCSSYPCVDVKAYQGTTGGALLLNQRHYFLQTNRYLYQDECSVVGTGYSLWSTGLERRTETRDGSDSVISAVEQDWSQRAGVSWSGGPCCTEQIQNDNRVNEARHYLDNGTYAKTDTYYQTNSNWHHLNNPIEVDEYDFDQSVKRHTVTNYVDSGSWLNGLDYTSDSIHLLGLPLTQTVYDGNWTQVAQTITEYDNYAADGNHAGLQDYGSVTGHDANYGLSHVPRGNPTAVGGWLNTNNSTIYSYLRYDTLGNPVGHKDPNGNLTTMAYADDYGDGSNPGGGGVGAYGPTYAFPTLLTSPPPQSGQPQQSARSQYDFWGSLLSGFRDRNNVVTQTLYNDPFDRPTQVRLAVGVSGVESHASMFYAPTTVFGITLTNNDVLTAKDQSSMDDAVLRSWKHTDGFGRTVQSWTRDPQGDDEVVSTYDALGRARQVSNSFRPSAGQSAIYTTTAYDLAGRFTSVTTPDTAVVSTSYSANTVTVTDPAGKQRRSVTDGFGRLIQVYEDPVGLNYLTSYTYDALDNLIQVNQSGQTRTFNYDSLKRLTSAWNPESNTVSYQYDNNGNLTQKTDARAVVSAYAYDTLNRNTSISYSDGTPSVNRVYDGATNGVGRLYYQWTSASDASKNSLSVIDAYDATGSAKNWRQHFWVSGNWGAAFTMSGSYDLAGHIISLNYPSGRTVNYGYDNGGRTNSFSGSLGDGVYRNYSTGISYSALGGMSQEQFGTATPIFNKLFYNSRGQLAEIREGLSGSDTSWERGAIINFFGPCWGMCGGENSTTQMPNNNGNIGRQEHWIQDANGNVAAINVQEFDYDSLNRIQRVHEGGSWQQQYNYDQFGNRTINQGSTWGAGISNLYFGVDPSTNRLTPAGGYTMNYDAAGNLTYDNYTGEGTRNYDAENRMTTAWANNQWQSYVYDAEGNRVKRMVNGAETWQVFGLGELVSEYSANGNPSSPQKEYGYRNGKLLVTAEPAANIHWQVADQLGTPRMIFDSSGSLANMGRHDYLPFGEDLAGVGGRSSGLGYTNADDARQKFTQKERDNETGLDYFFARYYSSVQGRFTSPDELTGGAQEVGLLGSGESEKQALPYADFTQPQSLNKYQYTYNNPVNYVDDNGHCPVCIIVAVIAIIASAEYVEAPTGTPGERMHPSGTGQRDLVNNIFIGEATGALGKYTLGPLARFAFPRLFADEAVSKVESSILTRAAEGNAFENRVLGIIGETKNTARVLQGEATGASYRVPDILTQKIGGVVGEIKSGQSTLRLTSQWKDLLTFAGKSNSTLKIYLQQDLKIAPKLADALKKAGAEVYDVASDGSKIIGRRQL